MSTKTLSKKIATNGDKPKGPSQAMVISEAITKQMDQFARVLPKGMEPDRLARIALTEMRKNPKLEQCTTPSILGALMTSAQLGLEPGVLGQCNLVPFWNNREKAFECQFVLGYKGIIELAYRSGLVKNIDARPVYPGDHFQFAYGLEQELVHRPTAESDFEDDPVAYYALIEMTTGGAHFHVMWRQQVINHMGKYAKGHDRSSSPWKTDFDAMAMKTCVRQMEAFIPKSVAMGEAFAYDGAIRESKGSEPELTLPAYEIAKMDYETGEIDMPLEIAKDVVATGTSDPIETPRNEADVTMEAEADPPPSDQNEDQPQPEPQADETRPPKAEDDTEPQTSSVPKGTPEVTVEADTEAEEDQEQDEDQGGQPQFERILSKLNKKELLIYATQNHIEVSESWPGAKIRNEITSCMIEAGMFS